MSRAEDVEDVVQDTLLLALRHFDSFRFEAEFSTWLCHIATNVIRGRFRKPDFRRIVFTDQAILERMEQPIAAVSQLTVLEKKEAASRLHVAISKLPCEYRVVVELRDLKGLSIRETASALSLSTPAVKSRHHRARWRLNTLLAG
jgi:RNA polymerase sigma-70 factor, ECF subfamily